MYPNSLSLLLDLPLGLAVKEANAKLSETIILINNELVYIDNFEEDRIYYRDREGEGQVIKAINIQSLDFWLPDTGIYSNRNNINQKIFLQRQPRRQWKRSFSGSFYSVKYLGPSFNILDTVPSSMTYFWIAANGKIMYKDEEVGERINDKQVLCKKKMFVQEIKDWFRDNQIGVENGCS